MWLNRPLGPWADELIRWCDGRCTINLVAHITTKNEHEIDVTMFKKAVFTLMYNEPHLRTDADLSVTPALWVPATDFSEAFHYEDLRDSGKKLDQKNVILLSHMEACTEISLTWIFVLQTYSVNFYHYWKFS